MFKVISREGSRIEMVYAVESRIDDCDSVWFLLFINDVWQWKNSKLFVPLNN